MLCISKYLIYILLFFNITLTYGQIKLNAAIINGDTVPYIRLHKVVIEDKGNWGYFESWERGRLERRVRKTLPLAKTLSIELYDRKERLHSSDKHIRKRELDDLELFLRKNYTHTIMDMSISEGKVLLKLIHRENGISPYETLKLLKSERNANFWSGFAGLFGTDLDSEWNPSGEDRMLNQIANKIENE